MCPMMIHHCLPVMIHHCLPVMVIIAWLLALVHPDLQHVSPLQVLEGYMLQGIQGKHLSEKVLQCFKEAILESTMKVVRSLILTKPK